MDYEKKYKEALERARDLQHDNCWVTSIFPELKESEDERIRGKLLQWLKLKLSNPKVGFVCEEMKQWIAWLEKKDESKFEQCIQEGDEIVTNEDGTHFNVSQLERVSKKVTDTKETAKKFLKTAGIMDKNGELADEYRPEKQGGNSVTITKCNNSITNAEVVSHPTVTASTTIEPKFKVGDWVVCEITGSAYQIRDCIENPYNHKYGYLTYGDYIGSSEVNQYHLWTIQDAKDGDVLQLGEVTAIFKKYIGNEHCICYCSFCKAGGFETPIENGEDNNYGCYNATPATKEQRDLLFQKMKEADYEWDAEKKELKIINWSKHIKYEPNCPSIIEEKSVIDEGKAEMDYCFTKMMNGEKVSSAWSEEDEENLNQLHKLIVKKAYEEYEIDTEDETLWGKYAILDNWLKSLKGRVQPNQWKPSEEQLNALNALNLNGDISYVGQQKQLIELYEQLEKL